MPCLANISASLLISVLFFALKLGAGQQLPVFSIEGAGWQNETHGGYIAGFKIPINVKLDTWWFALVYEQAIPFIEAWQAVPFQSSEDNTIHYLKNIRWNVKQSPGMQLAQRFMIEFEILPGVNYDNYGPRPTIVFLDKVYIPSPTETEERPMVVENVDQYTLPANFVMLPVNIVTTPSPPPTESLAPLTPGPGAGKFWWVRTLSPPARRPTQTSSITSTLPTTITPATTTQRVYRISCWKAATLKARRCPYTGELRERCLIPQCSKRDRTLFRVVQCWKHRRACWCVNPTTGRRDRSREIVRFTHVIRINCGRAVTTTTAPTASTLIAPLPRRPPNAPALVRPIFVPRSNYDYDLVLHFSLLFFEAQRSGDIGDNGRIFWRRSAHTNDGSDCRLNLSGGYYVSGDYVKYGFPAASAMTVLAWGFLEFKDAYDDAGQTHFLKEALRWGADYFMKAHVARNVLVGQVGDPDLENSFWERPQDMRVRRPCFSITERNPGSDLAAETAAALAATAKVWLTTGSNASNPYVVRLLQHARQLYEFAANFRGQYSYSIRKSSKHYASSSYGDELAWAALWLYEVTREQRYLSAALGFYGEFNLDSSEGEFSWDRKTVAVQLLLSKHARNLGDANRAQRYLGRVNNFCDHIRSGGNTQYTPQGLLFMNEWGTTRYACNAVFICIVASTLPALDENLKLTFRQIAESQVDYLLGKTGRSYVVGYGYNYPKNPHHRASSCRLFGVCGWDAYHSNSSNPQVLQGALVGGPDRMDNFRDQRSNFKSNGVGLDYNAGLQGVVAGLKHFQLEHKNWRKYSRRS